MATLTDSRRLGSHLKLVPALDDGSAMTLVPTGRTVDPDDSTPGPRDASALVARFSRVLSGDVMLDGIFSFGEGQTQPPA